MKQQFEPLKIFFNNIHPLSEDEWEYVSERLELKSLSKNKIITQQGYVENYTYFILKGIVRLFIETADKDITLDIHFTNDFANGYTSFLTRKPSHFNVQALTDVELIAISYDKLEDFYKNIPAGNFISRKMAEYTFVRKATREVDFLTKSPTERYLNLINSRPDIIKHIPLNHIASYLGVTPQALSRIRKRIS
tara:strand:+ start:1256 stop:1834 length:579 start_codon:yes stop_codon:yes gene_type:complete